MLLVTSSSQAVPFSFDEFPAFQIVTQPLQNSQGSVTLAGVRNQQQTSLPEEEFKGDTPHPTTAAIGQKEPPHLLKAPYFREMPLAISAQHTLWI